MKQISLFRAFTLITILTTFLQCQNESKSIKLNEIKNEFNDKKVKIGYWIEYRNQNNELKNEPEGAVLFRVVNYENGFPKGEVTEYLPNDSSKYVSYKVSIDEPNTVYKFNKEKYIDTVFYYDKYGTCVEKNYYYYDSIGTKLKSEFNIETSEYETIKIITKPSDDFIDNLSKVRELEKYFTNSDKEIWAEMWDSNLSGEENTKNIFTTEYADGRKQSYEEKSQIFEKLISSAEANRYKTRFKGGTLSSLKRCKTYNDFVSWINGWEKSYTAELNKAYMLNNSNNRKNQTINIFNKYAFYSDGYQKGPVRGWVIQLALNNDLSQNQVDDLEKKIDASYERCGDLYTKCLKK